MTIEDKVREAIALIDYQWRFCGIPDEHESEWLNESQCTKQNCREFAQEILSLKIEDRYKLEIIDTKAELPRILVDPKLGRVEIVRTYKDMLRKEGWVRRVSWKY